MAKRYKYLEKEGYATKPMYTPPELVDAGKYTTGKEWMDIETEEEYIGFYHQYPNGATYSGAELNEQSRHLMPYTITIEPQTLVNDPNVTDNFNNSEYFRLTGARFSEHYTPRYYYPQPVERDYEQKFIQRYFAQRVNNIKDITEISQTEFDLVNEKNKPGIDGGLYKVDKILWTIAGPIDEVRKVNARVRAEFARTCMPRITDYLSELDEYHKSMYDVNEDSRSDAQKYVGTRNREAVRTV
jgi:hypothetical protein